LVRPHCQGHQDAISNAISVWSNFGLGFALTNPCYLRPASHMYLSQARNSSRHSVSSKHESLLGVCLSPACISLECSYYVHLISRYHRTCISQGVYLGGTSHWRAHLTGCAHLMGACILWVCISWVCISWACISWVRLFRGHASQRPASYRRIFHSFDWRVMRN
jgi:hypothetical protein